MIWMMSFFGGVWFIKHIIINIRVCSRADLRTHLNQGEEMDETVVIDKV